MFAYLQVYFYYMLPPIIILYLLLRPLLSNFDKFKLILIVTFAVLPSVCHKVLRYRKVVVVAAIEESLFVILQAIFAVLWTSLCTRWALNSLDLKAASRLRYKLARFSVIVALKVIMYVGPIFAIPAAKTFHTGSMISWSLPPLIVLWYMCGPYVCKRYASTLLSVVVPSIYFCCVDVIAGRARARHINKSFSLNGFIIDDLPMAHVAFFILTNTVIALSLHAVDKAKAIIDTHFSESFPLGARFSASKRLLICFKMLLNYAFRDGQYLDPFVISDLEACHDVIHRKSYSLAGKLYPNGNAF